MTPMTTTDRQELRSHGPTLGRLVGDTDAFLEHWEHAPAVVEASADVARAFPLDRAFSLLGTPGLPVSCFRLLRDGAPVPQQEYSAARERPGPGREPFADGAALLRAYEDGATIIFEEVRLLVPEVAALASGLEEDLGFGIYCAAFLTPAGNSGARPHYDLASGLLCQIHGSKVWSVGDPSERWPATPCGDARPEFDPVLETVLRPGQTLYIPRGHPHAGAATDEPSLHLSFAIKPRTWRDVLQSYIRLGETPEPLRELLPLDHAGRPPEELAAEAVDRLRAVLRSPAG
ncbi:JmjC domain-containing protein [Nocardiopsis tropica]|uniref:Cupin domain-containing protein n=1 Tax=Nocardiopsis tropica TaxID=109330 RepID=A0ABU7KI40_9ACTN|nr:cupin domain-containing protein [Nocardiopsis umidischolae]MEE2048966.1 cupin domain-containing protein [Nocardiopsis umidischolae]